MEKLAESGPEPMRNMFMNARVLYCHESGLPEIAAKIPIFQKNELELFVINAPNKPSGIVEKCRKFMTTLSDEDALVLIESYEGWTSYHYPDPKNFQFIANNYFNPWEY